METKKTLCNDCNKKTESNRVGRCRFICDDCGGDKSMSDFYQYELYNN